MPEWYYSDRMIDILNFSLFNVVKLAIRYIFFLFFCLGSIITNLICTFVVGSGRNPD